MIFQNHTIEFDPTNCVGCKMCYQACFIDVIQWDAENKRPVFKYMNECEHCNYCEVSCKKGCIKVIVNWESQRFIQSFDMYK
ncbi:MAG: 4Fe-4S binding protein [Parasporobacterium sp.]|nr:4Fe-4S binding protein [Parasporobacterium sp.]